MVSVYQGLMGYLENVKRQYIFFEIINKNLKTGLITFFSVNLSLIFMWPRGVNKKNLRQWLVFKKSKWKTTHPRK